MFKFYTIPSDDIIEKLIGMQATIKLSSVFNLNDPYELKFNLEIDPTAEYHEKYYYKSNPNSTREDFLNWQRHAIEHDGYTWYIEQQLRNDIAQTITLCSFTESNKNNLMWSHYTNNHRGICIEYKPELFDYLKTLKGFILFGKVSYSDNPPTVKGLENLPSIAKKTMFFKQTEWKYEKEHRIVFHSNNNADYLPIDSNFIQAVYIGSRISPETESKILTICKNSHIDVYHGITLGKSYEVNFEKHKEGKYFSKAFWQ